MLLPSSHQISGLAILSLPLTKSSYKEQLIARLTGRNKFFRILGGHRASLSAAFTLVELLVSMAVLILLILLVTQLLNSATKVTTGSRNHLEADNQARLVFDRMAADFSSMLKRKDADNFFEKVKGNDDFYFFSEAPAYYVNGTLSEKQSSAALIGYRINSTTLQLERLGKGLTWDGASASPNPGAIVFLTYPPADPLPAATPTPFPKSTISGNWNSTVQPTSTDTDFHVISDEVFRLEFTFLLTNGKYSNQPFIAPNDSINGFKDVSAIIVTIGILDNNSRKIQALNASTINALPDVDAELVANPPVLAGKKWGDIVVAPGFASAAALPQIEAGQVRIYQRTFYLNSKF